MESYDLVKSVAAAIAAARLRSRKQFFSLPWYRRLIAPLPKLDLESEARIAIRVTLLAMLELDAHKRDQHMNACIWDFADAHGIELLRG